MTSKIRHDVKNTSWHKQVRHDVKSGNEDLTDEYMATIDALQTVLDDYGMLAPISI